MGRARTEPGKARARTNPRLDQGTARAGLRPGEWFKQNLIRTRIGTRHGKVLLPGSICSRDRVGRGQSQGRVGKA